MKSLLIILALLIVQTSFSQDFESLRQKLENIERRNIELRSEVMPTIKEFGYHSAQMDSLNARILAFDSVSLVYVIGILDKYGWMGQKEVGVVGNRALFLVIQHAQDPLVMKKYYPLLEESAKKGESELYDMAMMKDRILVEEGKAQIYGTQYKMEDGKRKLFPIEDPKNVNKRRRSVGLKRIRRR